MVKRIREHKQKTIEMHKGGKEREDKSGLGLTAD